MDSFVQPSPSCCNWLCWSCFQSKLKWKKALKPLQRISSFFLVSVCFSYNCLPDEKDTVWALNINICICSRTLNESIDLCRTWYTCCFHVAVYMKLLTKSFSIIKLLWLGNSNFNVVFLHFSDEEFHFKTCLTLWNLNIVHVTGNSGCWQKSIWPYIRPTAGRNIFM